jgi:hypothetical protein
MRNFDCEAIDHGDPALEPQDAPVVQLGNGYFEILKFSP